MNRLSTITSLGAAALVAAFLLAGCAPLPSGGDDPGEPTTPPTVTVTAPAPEPETAADYGFTFFREATLGSTWEEMSDQLNYPVIGMPQCPYYGPLWQTEAAFTGAFFDPDAVSDGAVFFYSMEAFIETSDYPRNAENVGVGSTVASVLAAYPTAVESSHTDLGAGDLNLITVDDPASDSKYVFAYYPGNTRISLLQWGPGAGSQWSHLCGGF